MASEGSREIEAARKRLAAATAQISVASKNKEAVKVMMENAKAMSAAAEKEGKEAEAMLKDAEKRWEVINIDLDSGDDESTQKNEGSNKRRKVSLSLQGNIADPGTGNSAISQTNSNTNNTTGIRRSGETMLLGQPPNRNTTSNITGLTTNNNYGRAGSQSTTSASTTASSSTVNQIRVEGCGISEVNGIYLQQTGLQNDFSKYSKTGIWEGKLVQY